MPGLDQAVRFRGLIERKDMADGHPKLAPLIKRCERRQSFSRTLRPYPTDIVAVRRWIEGGCDDAGCIPCECYRCPNGLLATDRDQRRVGALRRDITKSSFEVTVIVNRNCAHFP